MDIRKVPNYNGRFYIHYIDTKKAGTPGTSKKSPLTVPTSGNNISQSNKTVNSSSSVKHSIEENKDTKKIQELTNSGRVQYPDGVMPVYVNNISQEKQKIKFKEIKKEIEENQLAQNQIIQQTITI